MIPVKHYVAVRVRFNTSGEIIPLAILWPDGRQFEIDRVLDVHNCASASGGAGRRYTVRIHGGERYLYYANDYERDGVLCWYIESKKNYKEPDE